jgi:hypothetical protein
LGDQTDILYPGIAESWYEFEYETERFMFKFIIKTSNAVVPNHRAGLSDEGGAIAPPHHSILCLLCNAIAIKMWRRLNCIHAPF